ncbi:MAG TPA: glycine--tRNA ligase, partial [Methanothermococcus okinawensis]|nr:glycine--tRNA ligase [Methanothermococcus okinawensis]
REEEDRVYLDLKPKVAPVKVGVFPLVNRDRMPEIAMRIKETLRKEGIIAQYDDRGAIGRRYMRMDEIGTPFCITVDGQTLEDGTVTVRYRNTREQERVKIEEVVDYIKSMLG